MDYCTYYNSLNNTKREYLEIMGLDKSLMNDDYFNLIERLVNVSMWCGMTKSGSHINNYKYSFRYDFSRAFHSIAVSSLAYNLTKDKEIFLASLVHDIGTPSTSHVVDIVLGDNLNHEITEKFNYDALNRSLFFKKNFPNIDIKKISNPKNYHILDSERPTLCLDRLDGILLSSLGWTKTITVMDVYNITDNIILLENEFGNKEIAFRSKKYAEIIYDLEEIINEFINSDNDKYGMFLLKDIISYSLEKGYLTIELLKIMTDLDLFDILEKFKKNDLKLALMLDNFYNPKEISKINVLTKQRHINPLLIGGKRLYEKE